MRYSIIMPIYDPEARNEALTEKALISIIKNSEGKEIEIIPVYHSDLNYSTAVNIGFKRSTGDYLIIASNDIEVRDKDWLEKYVKDGHISSYRSNIFYLTHKPVPDASIWGMPRDVFDKIGLLDEDFQDGYGYEDSDYWMRAEALSIPFHYCGTDIFHHENKTFSTYFGEKNMILSKLNETIFLTKYPHLK